MAINYEIEKAELVLFMLLQFVYFKIICIIIIITIIIIKLNNRCAVKYGAPCPQNAVRRCL